VVSQGVGFTCIGEVRVGFWGSCGGHRLARRVEARLWRHKFSKESAQVLESVSLALVERDKSSLDGDVSLAKAPFTESPGQTPPARVA
jgi:hypothetical protein